MLAKKGAGKEAKLSYSGHVLMENRNGLVAEVEVLQANGTAERDAALVMIEKRLRRYKSRLKDRSARKTYAAATAALAEMGAPVLDRKSVV